VVPDCILYTTAVRGVYVKTHVYHGRGERRERTGQRTVLPASGTCDWAVLLVETAGWCAHPCKRYVRFHTDHRDGGQNHRRPHRSQRSGDPRHRSYLCPSPGSPRRAVIQSRVGPNSVANLKKGVEIAGIASILRPIAQRCTTDQTSVAGVWNVKPRAVTKARTKNSLHNGLLDAR
jgi:hypothetical protein